MPVVLFHNADIEKVNLQNRRKLKAFINEMFKREERTLERLEYVFTGDNHLLDINRRFLNHDFLTDIITFDLSEKEETVGEVYISVERVKENASERGISFQAELLRVIFHGSLHLIGYKDKKKSEITLMRQKEDEYLSLFEKQLKESST